MKETISILRVVEETTVDGPGFRTAIYAAGCPNHCPGCHNPESWDINAGRPTAVDELLRRILSDDFADVTFSGGDPMFQAQGFTALAREIKAASQKTIWCYTGFTFEDCLSDPVRRGLLEEVDVLVDGRFERSLRDETLRFRGSSNQRIIDVKRSLKEGKIVLYEEFDA